MSNIPSPKLEKILFKVEVPDETVPTRRGSEDEKSALRLTCGYPDVINLIDNYPIWKEKLSKSILSQLDRYEFWLVQLAFTLHIKPNYSVQWLEIGVNLETPDYISPKGIILGSNTSFGYIYIPEGSHPPIAYNLYPKSVGEPVNVHKSLVISPSLEFQNVKIKPGEASLSLDYVEIHPKITAFGIKQQDPYWRYEPGISGEVERGIKELRLIVCTEKKLPVHATVWTKGNGKGLIFPKKFDNQYRPDFYF